MRNFSLPFRKDRACLVGKKSKRSCCLLSLLSLRAEALALHSSKTPPLGTGKCAGQASAPVLTELHRGVKMWYTKGSMLPFGCPCSISSWLVLRSPCCHRRRHLVTGCMRQISCTESDKESSWCTDTPPVSSWTWQDFQGPYWMPDWTCCSVHCTSGWFPLP